MRLPPVAFILRRKLRRSNARIIAVQIMIALVGSALVVMAWDSRPDTVPAATANPATQESGFNSAADASASKVVARTDAAVIAAAAGAQAPSRDITTQPAFDIGPPVVTVDGTSVRWNDIVIHLHGVEGPRADHVCLNEEGYRWACGLRARAALHNLVAHVGMRCKPVRWAGDAEMEAVCDLQGQPSPSAGGIARQLVLQGWARPNPAGAGQAEEVEQARSGRLGLWRGGWRISQ